jgi:CRISPR-associated endonuclease/helicase Cas3
MKHLSHPDKLLSDHIENIIAFCKDDRLFELAAKYHDLGKTTDSFQAYIQKQTSSSEPHAFVSAVVFLVNHIGKLEKKELVFVANAIISHHGRLVSLSALFDSFSDYKKIDLATKQKDEIFTKDDVVSYFCLAQSDLSKLKRFRFEIDMYPLQFDIGDFIVQKLLFSRLIFADKFEAIFSKTANPQTTEFDIENLHSFKKKLIKNQKRDTAREVVLSNYNIHKDENIFLLTAPTGVGKTLLSLELALLIKKDKNRRRVIYTIPFTSIIDQSVDIFEQIFPDMITKHHHKSDFRSTSEETNNSYDRMKFIVESWSDPFIVSTFYQLLFAIFSNRNSDNVKFQSLENSVIIMDEVQAIPHHLWSVVREIFEELANQINCTFLLMSATMPVVTKNAVELADKELFYSELNRYRLLYQELSNSSYEDRLEEIKELIIKRYKEGKSVLCVANTIKSSKLLYKLLKNELKDEVFCLNSYMLGEDREICIKNLKEPDTNCVKHKVLISTQVIEAGVDLDFDTGFRELAPLSSIIQTAGRVNREGKKAKSDVVIFDTVGFDIYDKTLMNETKKYLVESLKIDSIEERDILKFVEGYFEAVSRCLGDSKEILKSIEVFDFEKIDRAINDIFRTEDSISISVAIGVDLKEYENRYFLESASLDKWGQKSLREKLFKEISNYVLNIKNRDLEKIGINIDSSDIFGIAYIKNSSGIYSARSGFLIDEERSGEDFFD